jgi:CDP-paratose 2-epimerase
MTLLVTGGCGFLGSNIVLSELRRGGKVVIFDNLSRLGSVDNLKFLQKHGEVVFHEGDIRNKPFLEDIVKSHQPKSIFHLAGQVAMTTSILDPRADFEINAMGTINVLEAVRNFSVGSNVIYSSTNKVYGDLEQFEYVEEDSRYSCAAAPLGFDEDTQLNFQSPYGCSKGAGDQYMLDYHRMYGLRTIVFRHSSMFGGRQHATIDQGWVGWFCEQAIKQRWDKDYERFSISGNGKQVRDVLHANDMVDLYEAAVENMDTAQGQVFNIGGGVNNSLSLLELMVLLRRIVRVDLRYHHIKTRESDQKYFVADITKAQRMLNWIPQKKTAEGIAEMVNWIENGKS